ncbi:MAG: CDP-alcohol phosphatidyltransferase family protein [Candidatus Thorarchaeota archaeon]
MDNSGIRSDENGEMKSLESEQEEKKTGMKIPDFPRPLRIFFAILANLITSLNFASGVTAIILVSIDPRNPIYALWGARLILLAIIFDFSDGIPARLAKKEPGFFGIIVDSAADTVSFGFAPAVLISLSLPFIGVASPFHLALAILSVVVGVYFGICTIIRLVRFTKSPSKKWFNGIPAPGAGCAAATYIIFKLYIEEIVHSTHISVPIVGLLVMIFTATMMIVKFRYPTTKLRKNFLEIFLLGLTAVVIVSLTFVPLEYIIYPAATMAALICLYVFYGPFYLLKHMLDRAKEVNDY